ncbi:MAG: hypothetical protein KatS3mg084_0615 [Candidatus Dojkabacteria bacterium]|jgi:intein/homing endonuclease|nr:MAG: hypothetical protein KatS3mg084_0615 [Candidatus Dojkabacteria bacterium]
MDSNDIKFFERLRIFNISSTILLLLFLLVDVCLLTTLTVALLGGSDNSVTSDFATNAILFSAIILFSAGIIIFGSLFGIGFYLSFINKKLSKRVWLLQVVFTLMTSLSLGVSIIFLLPISIYFLVKLFQYQNYYYTNGGSAKDST